MRKNKEITILEKELQLNDSMYSVDLNGDHIISIDIFEPEYQDIPVFKNDVFDTLSKFRFLESINIDIKIENSYHLDRLSTLKYLKSLILTDARTIENIDGLRDIETLETFIIDAPIKDISPLARSKQLSHLALSRVLIENLQPLNALQNIETLNLSSDVKTDIESISHLNKLKVLHISSGLSDLSPISKLYQLTNLSLYGNAITDLKDLKSLENLQHLNLVNNSIEDAQVIAELRELRSLHISYNKITDCSFLSALDKLQYLDISNNPIKVFPEVIALKELTLFKSNSVPNINISLLDQSPKLSLLALEDCNIDDTSFLNKFSELHTLQLANNKISEINPLATITSLRSIDLRNNMISDIVPINSFPMVNHFDFRDNEFLNTSIGSYYSPSAIKMQEAEILIGHQYFRQGKYDDALSYYYSTRQFSQNKSFQKEINTLRIYLSYLKEFGIEHAYFSKYYLHKCLTILKDSNSTDGIFNELKNELIEVVVKLGMGNSQYVEDTLEKNLPYYDVMREYFKYRKSKEFSRDHPEALFEYALKVLSNKSITTSLSIHRDLIKLESPFRHTLFKRILNEVDTMNQVDRKFYMERLLSPDGIDHETQTDYIDEYKMPEPYVYKPSNQNQINDSDSAALKVVIWIAAIILSIAVLRLIILLFSYPG